MAKKRKKPLSKLRKRKWTVVGYYTDNNQPWIRWIMAKTAAQAAASVRPQWGSAVVEVFEGHKRGCLCNEEILFESGIQALHEEVAAGGPRVQRR